MSNREKRRPAHRPAPRELLRGARRVGEGRRRQGSPGRPHLRQLPPRQAPGVAGVHFPRPPLGAGKVSGGVLRGSIEEEYGGKILRRVSPPLGPPASSPAL